MIPVKPVIEADLLIVGGGIGGLMAGIAAGKAGCKNVVIMEKCHARRAVPARPATITSTAISLPITATTSSPYSRKPCRASWASSRNRASCNKFLEKSFELVQMWCLGSEHAPDRRLGMQGATPCPASPARS